MTAKRESVLVQHFERLKVWRRGSERAPHKPLLLLLALARLAHRDERLVEFTRIEEPLRQLLIQYGPSRKSRHPEYPFWRLQADGVWQVENHQELTKRKGNSDPLKSELIKYRVKGGFPKHIFDELQKRPNLLDRVARVLLDANFPESLHEDILNNIGLSLPSTINRRRSGAFANDVLKAYGNVCAVCGYDVRFGGAILGLEAAHIKWFQAGGPDTISNGLALCTLHHKAFDYGAIGITEDLIVVLSCDLHGPSVPSWFEPHHGKKLYLPPRTEWFPNTTYVRWHTAEVFRHPARDLRQ
jgi:putative restriction endonuclease